MTNNTQPPAELAKAERLKWDAKIKEGVSEESRWHFLEGIEEGAKSIATEYVALLHQARALLEKVAFRHEGGLLPDRFIYDEIKTFLDGGSGKEAINESIHFAEWIRGAYQPGENDLWIDHAGNEYDTKQLYNTYKIMSAREKNQK